MTDKACSCQECEACKQEKETTQQRQSYGYMGALGIFKNLCDECAESVVMWYHCLPPSNVKNIILWNVEEKGKELEQSISAPGVKSKS